MQEPRILIPGSWEIGAGPNSILKQEIGLTSGVIQRLEGGGGGGTAAAAGAALHLAVQRRREGLDVSARVHVLILRNPNNKKPPLSPSFPPITG